ncbi:hypothetical protein I7I50_06664 [Histoplasma capsulatum G186AR]|uniref:Uncharacterized protein n=1 Tax=Ajellomyces capsulatus TaxID=5037 RepID=A0A8H8D318_AJECA|nr:hypothetical protein I7I52_10262 [Histoplasma capsulatum]QSS67548.1 hypothetical protein I7I50_06664 [Histoplasma capsulatum G186AR]
MPKGKTTTFIAMSYVVWSTVMYIYMSLVEVDSQMQIWLLGLNVGLRRVEDGMNEISLSPKGLLEHLKIFNY